MRPGQVISDQGRKSLLPVVRPEILVAAQRHFSLKLDYIPDAGKAVVAAEPRICGTAHQPQQCFALRRFGVLTGQLTPTQARIEAEQRRHVDHGITTVEWRKRARAVSGFSGTSI